MYEESDKWLGCFAFTFGKYKGRMFDDIPLKELDSYLGWMEKNDVQREDREYLKKYLSYHSDELEQELEDD